MMSYKDFSKYRGELMGIAILLIMFSHNTMDFPGFFHNINSGLQMLGQSGVDIFFFMSGFGCFYSFFKNRDVVAFYKKRVLRMFPAYLVVIFFFGIYSLLYWKVSLKDYLWTYSLISFYVDNTLNEWFIASIIVLYLLYPIIFYIVERDDKLTIALLTLIYLVLILNIGNFLIIKKPLSVVVSIFGTRIPAFILGSLFAKKSMSDGKLSNLSSIILTVLGMISAGICLYCYKAHVACYWNIIRVLFIFVILAVMIIWVFISKGRLGEKKVVLTIKKILVLIGGCTLEIYLLHEKILGIFSSLISNIFSPICGYYCTSVIVNIILAAASIVFANWLRILCSKTVKR